MTTAEHLSKKKDDYSALLDDVIKAIRQFQNIDAVSLYFHFLIECFDKDLNRSQRQELLKSDYPLLRKHGDMFNSSYISLRSSLKDYRASANEKQIHKVSSYINLKINAITKDIEDIALKEVIRGQYHKDVFYQSANHDGLLVRQVRDNVWERFNLDLLDKRYLFEEYREMLLNLVGRIKKLEGNFISGKWQTSPKKMKSIVEKCHFNLQNIIAQDKWPEFIGHCDYYSEERVICNKAMTLIQKKKFPEKYIWNLELNKAPVYAAFVKRLVEQKYLESDNIDETLLFKYFLYFFTGEEYSTTKANDIAKYYYGTRSNKYFAEFNRIK